MQQIWHVGGLALEGQRHAFGRSISTCAVHDGRLYAADVAGLLYCFDAATGAKQSEYDLKAHIWASPYWADGKIYLGTEDGELFVFRAGKIIKLIAKMEMSAPIRACVAAANGVLFVMTDTHLYALAKKK